MSIFKNIFSSKNDITFVDRCYKYYSDCDFVLLNDKEEVVCFTKKEAIECLESKKDMILELAKKYNINIEDFE